MRGEGNRRITPIGWAVLAALVACGVLSVVADGPVRVIAIVIAGIVLLMLLSEGMTGDGDVIGSSGRKHEINRRGR